MCDEYGICVGEIKEKNLVKSVDAFLDKYFSQNSDYNMYRNNKLSKCKNRGGVDDPEHPEKTFIHDYSYDYFNKCFGVYLMIYGNRNKSGETKYSEEIEWIIMINKIGYYSSNAEIISQNNPTIEEFTQLLLSCIGTPYKLLKHE